MDPSLLESQHSFPVFRVQDGLKKGPLDRFLSIFADVRAGEGANALLLAANIFLILGAYYILKTIRDALILAEGGAEVKSYSAAGQAALMLLVVPAYGAFASRVNRVKLISWVMLFFISHLFVFAAVGAAGVHVGVVFFLWAGVFNFLVVSQFWAFANDLYTERQGKRLFPIVGVGSSLGALLGAQIAAKLFKDVSPYFLMVAAAVVLAIPILLTIVVNRRMEAAAPGRAPSKPLDREGGFQLIFRSRYLTLIAVLIMLLNVVNTTGEFILGKMVVQAANEAVGAGPEHEAARTQFIGSFIGGYFTWVNLLGLLAQAFLVSRIFRYLGVRGALFILPTIAMGGYFMLAAVPMLGIARVVKIFENSTDYSIQNTARHALFLPTSREAKYKAKAAVDTFFARSGDLLQAGVVLAGTAVALDVRGFAALNTALALVWMFVVVAIYKEHKRLTSSK